MTDPQVELYFENATLWQSEMLALRSIVLDCGLTETYKWRCPCYTLNDANILNINALKNYCAIGFFKGSLLADPQGILYQQTENMHAVRIIRFTTLEQIFALKDTIAAYIFEAIAVEKAGLKVDFKKDEALQFPPELLQKFDEEPAFKSAFLGLTPGKQKGYNLFFTGSKQANTRAARIEKHVSRIMQGKGIFDCICGLSKNMPKCDGSHKLLEQ